MKVIDLNLFDRDRSRKVPVLIYLPSVHNGILPAVIFGPGYQSQKDLLCEKPAYKRYEYLAKYFTNRCFAFISIQHDIPGDTDGLEIIDQYLPQHYARKHLYERGAENISFVLKNLVHLPILLDKFIIAGHSNGGDIAKYFANNNPELVSNIIVFDARRCKLETQSEVRLLMFEADDTETDLEVLPKPNQMDNSRRTNSEWVIIKPRRAVHRSYLDDYITDDLQKRVFRDLDYFLQLENQSRFLDNAHSQEYNATTPYHIRENHDPP